jgi:hypothetical protein
MFTHFAAPTENGPIHQPGRAAIPKTPVPGNSPAPQMGAAHDPRMPVPGNAPAPQHARAGIPQMPVPTQGVQPHAATGMPHYGQPSGTPPQAQRASILALMSKMGGR